VTSQIQALALIKQLAADNSDIDVAVKRSSSSWCFYRGTGAACVVSDVIAL